jgi:predicted phage terminase large subunit-like protein
MRRSSVKAPHRDLTIDEIEREWARRQLVRFTNHTFPDYRTGWFHRVVAAEADRFLAEVVARQSPRLILTAPPQHGKSELISRRLPAFALGQNPDLKIIATSYSADRALDFSGDVQRIIDSEAYHLLFPETRIVGQFAKIGEAKRTAALFEVVGRRGRYRAAGIGGGITGEPADILIIDDPIKDFSEAISDTIRESVWNWLTSTAMTRLQEGGGIIVMATRWHLDDPIGRLLERQPGRWKLMNFRAIAEEDELPYRLTDEPLSVERFGLDALIQIRDGGAMNRYQWAALYQQRPSPLGGGIFQRDDWRFYNQPPTHFDEVLQSWDCAFKDKSSSDYVVGQVWGRKAADKFLLDQVRGHLSFSATIAAVRTLSAKWPNAHRKLVEDKANGTAVIDTLKHEISGIIAVEPEGGKEARAHAVSSEVEAHNVYLPEAVPWVHDFIEECAAFPAGAHDDQVDAMTQALTRLRRRSLSRLSDGAIFGTPPHPEFQLNPGWANKIF